MPVMAEMIRSLRPHFIVRLYCFGGAACPSSCGVMGANAFVGRVVWRVRCDVCGSEVVLDEAIVLELIFWDCCKIFVDLFWRTWRALRRQELARGLDITLYVQKNVLFYMGRREEKVMCIGQIWNRKINHDAKMLSLSYRTISKLRISFGCVRDGYSRTRLEY